MNHTSHNPERSGPRGQIARAATRLEAVGVQAHRFERILGIVLWVALIGVLALR